MCHIAAAKDSALLAELAELGISRGGYRTSLMSMFDSPGFKIVFPDATRPIELLRSQLTISSTQAAPFRIYHTQAPTGDSEVSDSHPAITKKHLLWHNGIIKSIADKAIAESEWDTKCLLDAITENGFQILSEVKGTFACLMINEKQELFAFRNTAAPLYFSPEKGAFCSVEFEDAFMLLPGFVYRYDPRMNVLHAVCSFDYTREEPYLFL